MRTEKEMSNAVANFRLFSPRQNFMIIERLSWGFFSWGECDLLIISKKHFLTEIEIKTSVSDFLNDFKKSKWKPEFEKERQAQIKDFYYAVPKEICEEVEKLLPLKNPNAGLICVDFKEEESKQRNLSLSPKVEVRIKSKSNLNAVKISDTQLLNIARLAMFRYWKNISK